MWNLRKSRVVHSEISSSKFMLGRLGERKKKDGKVLGFFLKGSFFGSDDIHGDWVLLMCWEVSLTMGFRGASGENSCIFSFILFDSSSFGVTLEAGI